MDFLSRLDAGRDAERLAITALATNGKREDIQKRYNDLMKTV